MMTSSKFGTLFTFAAAAGLTALTGCVAHHVHLEAPESDAPLADRQAAYAHLQPVSVAETHITQLRWGAPAAAARRTDYLQLKGGERVYEADDLWPVIAETSVAAKSVKSYEDKSSAVTTLNWICGGLATVGLGTTLYWTSHRGSDPTHQNNTLLYFSLSSFALSIAALLGANYEAKEANDEKATAFEAYDEGLRSKLNLCEAGGQMDDCSRSGNRKNEAAEATEPKPSDDK